MTFMGSVINDTIKLPVWISQRVEQIIIVPEGPYTLKIDTSSSQQTVSTLPLKWRLAAWMSCICPHLVCWCAYTLR